MISFLFFLKAFFALFTLKFLFIYFRLCWVFISAQAFPDWWVRTTLAVVRGFLLAVASLVSEHRLWGAWASGVVALGLWNTGSGAVVHGLSCSAACGIFLDQGSNPCPLHWHLGFLSTEPAGEPLWWWLNGHGFGWTLGVGDGQGGLACCGPWGHRESDNWATEQQDFNTEEFAAGAQPRPRLQTGETLKASSCDHTGWAWLGDGWGWPLQGPQSSGREVLENRRQSSLDA